MNCGVRDEMAHAARLSGQSATCPAVSTMSFVSRTPVPNEQPDPTGIVSFSMYSISTTPTELASGTDVPPQSATDDARTGSFVSLLLHANSKTAPANATKIPAAIRFPIRR